jgi:hypothetical protein
LSIADDFHKLEKECVGYNDYVNADEEHYLATLDGIRLLVERIQKENIFSPNEEVSDIVTEHLKLLMVPYYEADTLFRIMDKREERVQMAHTYYLEYLKLMEHYKLLEKHQTKQWKELWKAHQKKKSG